jgi:hypothetical protein
LLYPAILTKNRPPKFIVVENDTTCHPLPSLAALEKLGHLERSCGTTTDGVSTGEEGLQEADMQGTTRVGKGRWLGKRLSYSRTTEQIVW